MEVKCFNNYVVLTQTTRSHFFALKKVHLNLARTSNHIKFLKRCKKWQVFPQFLFLHLPFHTKNSTKLRYQFASALLNELLSDQKAKLARLQREEVSLRCLVFSHTDLQQWEILWDYIATLEELEFNRTKDRQVRKFEFLCQRQESHQTSRQRFNDRTPIVNLSKRNLDRQECKLLERGLNFVPYNNKFNNLDIATSVELAFRRHQAVDQSISSLLKDPHRKVFTGRDNLSYNERKALIRLKTDKTICILPADKGKAVVILDKSHYDEQLDSIVYSDAYKKLDNDPSAKIDNDIRSIVRELKKLPGTPNNISTSLISHNSRDPSIYGLPKVHKVGVPLRLIVPTYGSVFECASKFIARILKFYQQTSIIQTSVPNSRKVLENIRDLQLPQRYLLVSFDVTNLFGSLDLACCRDVIRNITQEDPLFEQRFEIPHSYFMELLDICLTCSFFKYKNEFFVQLYGVPMGSPCSPAIADLYLRDLERKIMALPDFQSVLLWNRYMDDVISLWKGTSRQIHVFLNKVNSLDAHVKFTVEIETENCLPFLDILLTKTPSGIQSSIYHKPTDSGLLINYTSYQPPNVKSQTVLGEAKRYLHLSDTPVSDMQNLKERFLDNLFPEKFIDNAFTKASVPVPNNTTVERPKDNLILPFMGPLSNKLAKKAKKNKLRLVSKNNRTLGSLLNNTKYNTNKTTNIVYQIPCQCGEIYVGETSKTLDTRIKQHKYAIQSKDDNNGISVHVRGYAHSMDWDNSRILTYETNFKKRKIKESLFIQRLNPKLNLYQGFPLKEKWANFI